MTTVNFEELLATLKDNVAGLAKETVTEYVQQATAEGRQALEDMKADLQRWSALASNGELDQRDLEFLIKGKKELIEMKALAQLGMAQIQLDKFKAGLINLIISSICKIV